MNEVKFFSPHLFKHDVRSNRILILVIILIMIMMANVVNLALSLMASEKIPQKVKDSQEDFFKYLAAMGAYNERVLTAAPSANAITNNNAAGADMDQLAGSAKISKLSYKDFVKADKDRLKVYEMCFDMASDNDKDGSEYTVAGFKKLIDVMKESPVSIGKYVKEFEYSFALAQSKGVFSGKKLKIDDMMKTTLEISGVSTDMVESMEEMDMTYMLNRMYFTVMGLLPLFILVVLLANTLVAGQVDNGSMAYILSTPTRRSAVTGTHIAFLVLTPLVVIGIVCAARMVSNQILYGDPRPEKTLVMYFGMYLLAQAVCGICFLGSCLFNQNRKALAFGGGITVWFFIASLLGMFGADNLVEMGVGVDKLNIFNKLTLVGLYDVEALDTVGTASVDTSFAWKLAVLAAVAAVCYIAGAARFSKKDLPL